MSQQFLGEIRIVTFNYPPTGWASCDGQILSLQQNIALFSLIGTQYGGNGINTFGLPNFQARVPVHASSLLSIGDSFGEQEHTLVLAELPTHSHNLKAVAATGTQNSPSGNNFSEAAASPRYTTLYGDSSSTTNFNQHAITTTGFSQPHENRQPSLVLNFIISLVGIFPSRS